MRIPRPRRFGCAVPRREVAVAVAGLAGVVLVGLSGLAGPAGAAESARTEDGIVLRTSVSPEEAWVGQRVDLEIDVLTPDGWAQIADLSRPDIPGAYVMRTESQGVRLNETIRGTAYSGQRYTLSVYGQRPGRLEIPGLPVTVTVKRWGATPSETRHEVVTPATALDCRVPPGAEGIGGLVSTSALEARQTWSGRPDTVAAGDAITRTVTLQAKDVSGMAFPPLQHPELEGVSVYPGEPSVEDVTNRGELRGERTEAVTYVFERPGTVTLPALTLPWWDLEARRLREIELEGLALVVAGEIEAEPDSAAAVAPPTGPRRDWRVLVAATLGAALLVLGVAPVLGRWIRRWRQERENSEAAHFRRVAAALRGGDPAAITAATMRWLDRLDAGPRPARLDRFLREYGDAEARAAAGALTSSLGAGSRFGEAAALGRGLRRARRHLLRSRRQRERAASVLPELNGPPRDSGV